jgi:hypothetical protein
MVVDNGRMVAKRKYRAKNSKNRVKSSKIRAKSRRKT